MQVRKSASLGLGLCWLWGVWLRGKPWSIDEERLLRKLIDEGHGVDRISKVLGKSRVSVRGKLYNLGLALKDATVEIQNHVAAASAAASSPVSVADLAVKCDPAPKAVADGAVVVDAVCLDLKASAPLPSVEEKLRVLDAALVALEKPGLSSAEVSRLYKIIQGVKEYQTLFAQFVNYRELEAEVLELRRQLALEKDQKK